MKITIGLITSFCLLLPGLVQVSAEPICNSNTGCSTHNSDGMKYAAVPAADYKVLEHKDMDGTKRVYRRQNRKNPGTTTPATTPPTTHRTGGKKDAVVKEAIQMKLPPKIIEYLKGASETEIQQLEALDAARFQEAIKNVIQGVKPNLGSAPPARGH
ncbi:hypothetical protein TWF694_008167 [Orbilia ellipsospora]|uniref:Secreted protein n=1 Tax=Orbilia ellipsospora TaxID=2528407 RepID=A0AAV9XGP2_9PEZI